MERSIKLVILDRDGVINQDRDDYVQSADQWVPIPGSLQAIGRLHSAGWRVVVASNQSGLGRGLFDMEALNAMHLKMQKELSLVGGRIDAIFFCPHAPEDECDCRKPKPGLFRDIAARYGLDDLQHLPVVGDSARDLEAGMQLGCCPHLVRSGKGERTLASGKPLPDGTRVHADLAAFTDWLLLQPVPLAPAPVAAVADA